MKRSIKLCFYVLLLVILAPVMAFAETEEEVRANLTSVLNEKFPGNSVTFNSIKPSFMGENARSKVGAHLAYMTYNYKWMSNEANGIWLSINISEDENTATVTVAETKSDGISVSKTLNTTWKDVNQQKNKQIKEAVQSVVNQLDDSSFRFVDMRTVKYNVNIRNGDSTFALRNTLLSEFMDTTDLSYQYLVDPAYGTTSGVIPMSGYLYEFAIYYKGVLYNYLDKGGFPVWNIIYIPSDTQETKEAYIAAAKAKVNKYFPTITFSDSDRIYQREINGIQVSSEQTFGNNLNDNFDPVYLNLNIGGQSYTYVIAKGTETQEKENIPNNINDNNDNGIDNNNSNSNTSTTDQVITNVPNTAVFRGIKIVIIGLSFVVIGGITIYYVIKKKSIEDIKN